MENLQGNGSPCRSGSGRSLINLKTIAMNKENNKNKLFIFLSIGIILILSLLLRAGNIGYGIEDEMTRPDESAYKDYVLWGIEKGFDLKLPESIGGFAGVYLNYLGVLSGKIITSNFGVITSTDLVKRQEFYSEAVHKPHKLFLDMRWISLIFSLGAIVVVFFLGRELFGSLSGIFSALLCAVSPLLVTEGKSGKEDSFVLFFMLMAAYGLVVWIKKERLWALRLTCFSAGVAFASKIVGILFVPIISLKIGIKILRSMRTKERMPIFKQSLSLIEICFLYFAGGYLFFNLNFFISPIEVLKTYSLFFNVFGPSLEQPSNIPFFVFEVLPYGIGWPISALAILAVFYFLFQRNWAALSLAVVCGMLLALLSKSPTIYDRYGLFLIPAAAVIGFGLISMVCARSPFWIRMVLPLLVLLISLWQLVPAAIATNKFLGMPSTRKDAGDFLRKEINPDESVLILRYNFWLGQGPMYGLNPKYRDWFDEPEWIEKAQNVVDFDDVRFVSLDKLGDKRPEWAVVEYGPEGWMSLYPEQMKKAEELLAHGYEEVFAVTPAQEFDKVKFNSWALPVKGLEHAQNYGPRIKIFRRVGE